ncbi:hypothetical protein [uncultured Tateyamaria sp.]|uniref:hypothetical protein n=1 Tax=uncultured Tateyamaria sp. TaxID=455651 RepID=UPI00261D8DF7|nr:hypothetical protein [uncultured Tateyamaria sp.]
MADALPDKLSANRLEGRKAELGLPYDGRWRWFWTKRKALGATTRFATAKPEVIRRYDNAATSARREFAKHKRRQRRKVSALWVRIILAAVFAVLRRYWVVLLLLASFGAIAFALWTFRDELIEVLRDLATPAPAPSAQSTPTPAGNTSSGRP